MISPGAVKEKWEQLQKNKLSFLKNTKFNSCIYILKNFTELRHSSFVALQEASDHVNFQVPTYYTWVGF